MGSDPLRAVLLSASTMKITLAGPVAHQSPDAVRAAMIWRSGAWVLAGALLVLALSLFTLTTIRRSVR